LSSSLREINKGDLVKITGRSYTDYEQKPLCIVLERVILEENVKQSFFIEFKLFCAETVKIFYWSNTKVYESLLKLDDYLECIETESYIDE
jgi:hypothetical protein